MKFARSTLVTLAIFTPLFAISLYSILSLYYTSADLNKLTTVYDQAMAQYVVHNATLLKEMCGRDIRERATIIVWIKQTEQEDARSAASFTQSSGVDASALAKHLTNQRTTNDQFLRAFPDGIALCAQMLPTYPIAP